LCSGVGEEVWWRIDLANNSAKSQFEIGADFSFLLDESKWVGDAKESKAFLKE